MVYGRDVNGKELNFEPSGGLLNASLVMRDRETDSWWSIMTSDAIGGPLEGHKLDELPIGEKIQWKDWVKKHPQTKVLSVGGIEYVSNNPYDNYFTSDETFRGLRIRDLRLKPKEPVYSFRIGEKPVTVPHVSFEGGALFDDPALDGKKLFLYRAPGSSVFASTVAFVVHDDSLLEDLVAAVLRGETSEMAPLGGFDTYWYSWVSVNPGSEILREP